MFIPETAALLKRLDPSGNAFEIHRIAYEYGAKHIAPLNREIEKTGHFPFHIWKGLADLDLSGITIDVEYGGLGFGSMAHMAANEAISYHSGSIGLSTAASSNLCANQIQKNGTPEQKKKYLPKLCSGETHGAAAMSETGAGSNVTAIQTTATDLGDGTYSINGSKLWITNGGTADVLIVYVKTSPELGKKGITAFIIEKDTPGFKPGSKIDKIGMRGSETWELFFDNCIVPKENILGRLNKGINVMMSGLNSERLVLSTGPLGIGQAALDKTITYANQREQFNQKIVEFQGYGFDLVDMATPLSTARAYCYMQAALEEIGDLTNNAAATAILAASDAGCHATDKAIEMYGGMGYTTDIGLGQLNYDCKLFQTGAGTKHIRKGVIWDGMIIR